MAFDVYVPAEIPTDEAARMRSLETSGLLNVGAMPAIQNIVWAAALCTGLPIVGVSIIDGALQRLVATIGIENLTTLRSTSFCAHAINTPDEIFCVPDTHEDSRFAGNPSVIFDPAIRFYAAAPLIMLDGRAGGALCVLGKVPRECLSDEEEGRLRQLARQIVKLAAGGSAMRATPQDERIQAVPTDGRAGMVRTAGLEPALSSRSGF